MATKKELEAEVQRLQRELGRRELGTIEIDTGAVQAAKAQTAMNASNKAGQESSLESRTISQARRAKHQAALRGEVEEAVVVQYDVG